MPTPPRAQPARITEVDVLRGFALFGITLANTVALTGTTAPATGGLGHWAFETLLHQRFFPIFSFLFGLSFGLFLDAVQGRTRSPRLLMLARLGFLVPFGALHRLLQPREVLLTYAVVGIIVLLPASYLPGRRTVLALGTAATAAAALLTGGSTLIPGLFLIGFAGAKYGPDKLLTLPTSRVCTALAITSVIAIALNVQQIHYGSDSTSRAATVAGLATAATYVIAIVLLLRTPIRRVLHPLAPVGRMALTCYIAATPLILISDQALHLDDGYGIALAIGMGVFVAELTFSMLWLRRARYGPLEWVWRCLTWWSFVPNSSRGSSRHGPAGLRWSPSRDGCR
ncbi:DUF418 domain-containing protein [Actinomadura geliboluensis]|uniref:DUF418 domain-containing protein n=1 Tax=Actinomadura geliboluensis TaxID=882440 RepID=A0A5S4GWC4_9ACTN|nr:DUF418 domain-containing protein [Actinomadura geliboluensis]TMR36801.1 DUF418 domain-containing protein [Actinomadura geliboluensis]